MLRKELAKITVSVVALMGWRIKITVDTTTRIDFAYGFYNMALVALLEVWCGIIVACMPTLAPFYSKHLAPLISKLLTLSAKHTSKVQMEKAHRTIGSSGPPRFRKSSFDPLDSITLFELEEGQNFRKSGP